MVELTNICDLDFSFLTRYHFSDMQQYPKASKYDTGHVLFASVESLPPSQIFCAGKMHVHISLLRV